MNFAARRARPARGLSGRPLIEVNRYAWSALRRQILIRDRWTCQMCGQRATSVDHIVPRAIGGGDDPSNWMAGQALTLRYIPTREVLDRTGEFDNRTNKQRLAVEQIGTGDVLVIDARGETHAGSLGNILAARVRVRGAAGIVTDGAFRDSPRIRGLDLPTYASGQSANISSVVHYPSEINVPIACGGVAVLPGDVLVGDAEGVIVIPRAVAEEVARDAADQERREAFIFDKVQAGSSIVGVYPPSDATLREYDSSRISAATGHEPDGRQLSAPER